jgi:hypothetical protein
MYSMALWFWSTVAASGLALAGLASTVSFAVPRVLGLSARFGERARRRAASLRDHAESVSRPSLAHHFDSMLPSHPSHPSNPRTC